MEFDKQRRVYLDDDGEVMSAATVRDFVDGYIDAQQVEIEAQATALRAGEITVEEFFTFLDEMIVTTHGTAAIIAYGGEDEMNPDRWVRVGGRIHEQIEYMKGFRQEVEKAQETSETIAHSVMQHVIRSPEIPDALDETVRERVLAAIMENSAADLDSVVGAAVRDVITDVADEDVVSSLVSEVVTGIIDPAATRLEDLIWGSVSNRSQSYMDAAYGTYENNVRAREADAGVVLARRVCEDDSSSCDDCPQLATDEYVSLDEIADIGESACGSFCRCYLEFSYEGITELGAGESLVLEGDQDFGTA